MGWKIGEMPHVQNDTFQRNGYLAVHDVACAGSILDPEQTHAVTRQKTTNLGSGREAVEVSAVVIETLREAQMFTVARNIGLGIKTLSSNNDNESYLTAIPGHVSEAAATCAATILADACPLYVVDHQALRIRR